MNEMNNIKSINDFDGNEGLINKTESFSSQNDGETKFVENSICKIEVEKDNQIISTGTGFLYKIPEQKNENGNIIVLITCYHVIKIIQKENGKYYYKDDDNKEIESISIKYHYKKKDYNNKLYLRNRRIWYDEEIDYIFIEIKKEEYELEEDYLYPFKSGKIPSKDDNIYIYTYQTQVKPINANYNSKCLNKEYKISYKILDESNTTSEGCSGSPVVYKDSIIAIHSEIDGKNDIRNGSLLEYIITHLNEQNKPHLCSKKNLKTTPM